MDLGRWHDEEYRIPAANQSPEPTAPPKEPEDDGE
jgi:endogenous inhibitor of DNA gyrase (YacG/DUF329 family)